MRESPSLRHERSILCAFLCGLGSAPSGTTNGRHATGSRFSRRAALSARGTYTSALHNGNDREDHAKDTCDGMAVHQEKDGEPAGPHGCGQQLGKHSARRSGPASLAEMERWEVIRAFGHPEDRFNHEMAPQATRVFVATTHRPQLGALSISGFFGAVGFAIPRGRIPRLPSRSSSGRRGAGKRAGGSSAYVRVISAPDGGIRTIAVHASGGTGRATASAEMESSAASGGRPRQEQREARRVSCAHVPGWEIACKWFGSGAGIRAEDPLRRLVHKAPQPPALTVNGVSRSWVDVSDAREVGPDVSSLRAASRTSRQRPGIVSSAALAAGSVIT
jgi:hypothetical protein